jgi:hypothetical protein
MNIDMQGGPLLKRRRGATRASYRRTVAAISAVICLVGCGRETAGAGGSVSDETPTLAKGAAKASPAITLRSSGTRSFFDFYETAATIIPAQSETQLIASVGDVEFAYPEGPIYLADPSQGNVKVYDLDGTLERVLGRKGRGPGEFMSPRFVQITAKESAYVVDTGQNRIEVFDSTGAFLNSIPFQGFSGVRGFGMLSDGSFLFLVGGPGDVLLHTDSTARILSRHLPIGQIRPEGEPDDGIWSYARNFFLDVRNDTAFVIASVSNQLWAVDVKSGGISRAIIDFPSYDPPEVPRLEGVEKTPQNAIKELLTHDLAGFIRTTHDDILIPFIRGNLIDGDPVTLLRGSPTGEWSTISDSPILVGAHGDNLIAVESPATDLMTFTIFRPRGPSEP